MDDRIAAECRANRRLPFLPALNDDANGLVKGLFFPCGDEDFEEERFTDKLRRAVREDSCLARRLDEDGGPATVDELYIRNDAYCFEGTPVLFVTPTVVCDDTAACVRPADVLGTAAALDRRRPSERAGRR